MNFLNIRCLPRSGYSPSWNCCRDNNIRKTTVVPTTKIVRQSPSDKNTISKLHIQFCNRRHLFMHSTSAWWTQVRYCKNYPRFHRDLEVPDFNDCRKDQFKDANKTKWGQADDKYGAQYLVAFGAALGGMYGTKATLIHYLSFMAAAADVLSLASIEIDISKVQPGKCEILKWRGKPIFIKHRNSRDIELEAGTPLSALKDPATEEQRTQRKDWLIVIGICTHLGCVPVPDQGDYAGGFYCPCHGSHYDNLGRIRKGPAPTNLEVPPYKFLSDTMLFVG